MIDSREPDVAQAHRLLVAAQRDGAVQLPELIAVDLCALGAALQAVFDEPVWRAWVGLPDAVRQEWSAASRAGLIRRRLLDSPAPVGRVSVSRVGPPLALIMAARSHPAFVAMGSVAGNQRGAPRMYGIADTVHGLQAVLVEHASAERIGLGTGGRWRLTAADDQQRAGDLHQLYQYLLVSPERAVQVFGEWLTGADGQGARTVDVLRHPEGAQLSRDRLTVVTDPSGANRVTCELTGDHAPSSLGYEPAHIPGLLTEMLVVRIRP